MKKWAFGEYPSLLFLKYRYSFSCFVSSVADYGRCKEQSIGTVRTWIISTLFLKSSVVDRHRFYAYPDPTLHFDSDPDPDPTSYT